MNTSSDAARLTDWTIIGFEERWHTPAPDVKQPGGTCWDCGTAIAYCVKIQSTQSTQQEIIGRDCAKKVGMDRNQLREYMASYYADRYDTQRAIDEAALTAEFGEHGTLTRYESGCDCRNCRNTAPHGTPTRWQAGCQCLECIDGITTHDPDTYWIVEDYPVIIDLATGQIVNAEIVDGDFGRYWRVRTDNGNTVNLALSPVRRTTHSKKGYVEAEAPALVVGGRGWHRLHLPLGEPLNDRWGQPIPHPAS